MMTAINLNKAKRSLSCVSRDFSRQFYVSLLHIAILRNKTVYYVMICHTTLCQDIQR